MIIANARALLKACVKLVLVISFFLLGGNGASIAHDIANQELLRKPNYRKCHTIHATMSPSRDWTFLTTRQGGFFSRTLDMLSAATDLNDLDDTFQFALGGTDNNKVTGVKHRHFEYGFISQGGGWLSDDIWRTYLPTEAEILQYDLQNDTTTRFPIEMPKLSEEWRNSGPQMGVSNHNYSVFLFSPNVEAVDQVKSFVVRIVDYMHNSVVDTTIDVSDLFVSPDIRIQPPIVTLPNKHDGKFVLQIGSYELSQGNLKRTKKIHLYVLDTSRAWKKWVSLESETLSAVNAKTVEVKEEALFYFQTNGRNSGSRSHLISLDEQHSAPVALEEFSDFAIDDDGIAHWRMAHEENGEFTYFTLTEIGERVLALVSPRKGEVIAPAALGADGEGFIFRSTPESDNRQLEYINVRDGTVLVLPNSLFDYCRPSTEF